MNGFNHSSIPKTSKKKRDRLPKVSNLDPHKGNTLQADPLPTFNRAAKGKAKEATINDEEITGKDEFVRVKATVRLSIPPAFSSNPMAGVEEMLDSMVMK
jgi:hypothetical protein